MNRAVKSAIDHAQAELEAQQKVETEKAEKAEKHTGPKADQRVDYFRGLVNKAES